MKTYFRTPLFLFLAFCMLNSCKKDEVNESTSSPLPRIATKSSYSSGKSDGKASYEYDKQGRQIKESWNLNDEYYITDYTNTKVTKKGYYKGVHWQTETYNLNSKGLAISGTQDSDDQDYVESSYVYNDNNYLISVVGTYGTKPYKDLYTILNGNCKSKIYEIILTQNPSIHSFQYQFYTDMSNTIGDENMGISFFGKQNINPTKEQKYFYDDDNPEVFVTTTYTYKYDDKGRIIKEIWNDGNSYCIYSYVE